MQQIQGTLVCLNGVSSLARRDVPLGHGLLGTGKSGESESTALTNAMAAVNYLWQPQVEIILYV